MNNPFTQNNQQDGSKNPQQSLSNIFSKPLQTGGVPDSSTLFGNSAAGGMNMGNVPAIGQPNNTMFGGSTNIGQPTINQPSTSLFGNTQPAIGTDVFNTIPNPINQPNINQPNTTLFGTNQSTINPPNINQPNISLFGTNQSTINQPNINQPNTTLFGTNQSTINPPNINQPNTSLFGNNQSTINQPNINQPNTSLFGNTQQQPFDQSKKPADQSTLISSMKDNTINLYNLSLQEIIDKHTATLETNIKEFEKDAQCIFERDLQLIKNKNNYLSIRNKIEEENVRLDELSQVLDYFEERLNGMEDGPENSTAKVIGDFEEICDKFYKKVEGFKDEQGDVLDLINENYQLIDSIDKKLDSLSEIKNIK